MNISTKAKKGSLPAANKGFSTAARQNGSNYNPPNRSTRQLEKGVQAVEDYKTETPKRLPLADRTPPTGARKARNA